MGQAYLRDNVAPAPDTPTAVTCKGGKSFGCRRLEPHQTTTARKFHCWRCHADLGCRLCALAVTELICLRCHDNGSAEAEDRHGPMIRDRSLGGEAFGLIAKVYAGKITETDAMASMKAAFAMFNRDGGSENEIYQRPETKNSRTVSR